MKTLLEKDDFSQDDICNLIESELEESIHIEFKHAEALAKTDAKKKEISKDISAFANSDGGLIFYGINEINHKASSLSFIDGSDLTKEWLEGVILSNIQQRIPDIKIIPVRFDGNIKQTIYVVKIPPSSNAPHMYTADKRYYKRFNFQAQAMEEYEVRDVYTRTRHGNIKEFIYTISFEVKSDKLIIKLNFQIANESNYPVEKYKVAFNISNSDCGLTAKENYSITNQGKDGTRISTTTLPILYPGETLSCMQLELNVKLINVSTFIKDATFDAYIYTLTATEHFELDSINKKIESFIIDYENDI